MSSSAVTEKIKVQCLSLLIETSPQALPLGAACIASSIKHNPRTKDVFHAELKSFSLESEALSGKTEGQVAQAIADEIDAPYVLFSVFVWNRKVMEKICAMVKQRNPGCICIAGGPEVTANPFTFENFDYTVCGEGEIAVPELIAGLALASGGDMQGQASHLPAGSHHPQLPQGVFARENFSGSLDLQNWPRAKAPDVSVLESPYLDGTIDPGFYGGALWELARGCPFKCSYCFESRGEKTVRPFSRERIERELELFNRKKINQVFVLDPTYNANKKKALEILELIRTKAPGMFFYFEARAEFIDRELARAFTKIPCALQFGLQSANPEVLKHVNRSLNKKVFETNVGILNRQGVVFGFDLIYGLPKDNLEGFKKSVDFALRLYPNNLETFRLSVLPGTELFYKAESLGLDFENTAPYHVTKTDCFSEGDLCRAEKISQSCNLFYNDGRAVPWFMSVCQCLKVRPVVLLEDFSRWLAQKSKSSCGEKMEHAEIERMQVEFLREFFTLRGKKNIFEAAENIIRFNGALSRVSDGKGEQKIQLAYHPDDLASMYASDMEFFSKNCGRHRCAAIFFPTKNGPDWKLAPKG